MYYHGQCVVKNDQTAYMFYLVALANIENELRGDIEKIVTRIESELTPTQIQSAQNDAVEYQAKIDARQ